MSQDMRIVHRGAAAQAEAVHAAAAIAGVCSLPAIDVGDVRSTATRSGSLVRRGGLSCRARSSCSSRYFGWIWTLRRAGLVVQGSRSWKTWRACVGTCAVAKG